MGLFFHWPTSVWDSITLHVPTCINSSFLFSPEYDPTVWKYFSLSSSVKGYLIYFQHLAIINKNIYKHLCTGFCMFHFYFLIKNLGMELVVIVNECLHGHSNFKFQVMRKCQTVQQSNWTISRSHQQSMIAPVLPHPHQNLV